MKLNWKRKALTMTQLIELTLHSNVKWHFRPKEQTKLYHRFQDNLDSQRTATWTHNPKCITIQNVEQQQVRLRMLTAKISWSTLLFIQMAKGDSDKFKCQPRVRVLTFDAGPHSQGKRSGCRITVWKFDKLYFLTCFLVMLRKLSFLSCFAGTHKNGWARVVVQSCWWSISDF